MQPSPISSCPSCSGRLRPSKLQCDECGLALEGDFPLTRLSMLTDPQQRFVVSFLLSRGNIKEVERELGISYPTVRKRLGEVARVLSPTEQQHQSQIEILEAIERDELSAADGIRMLRKGGSP